MTVKFAFADGTSHVFQVYPDDAHVSPRSASDFARSHARCWGGWATIQVWDDDFVYEYDRNGELVHSDADFRDPVA